MGADWNVALQAIDKKHGTPWRPTLYRDKRIWFVNDTGKRFSCESKALKVSSTIYFFLVSKSGINCFVNTKISNAPDHKTVLLDPKITCEKRGLGLWKLNNSLVEDKEYVNKLIEENYTTKGEKDFDLKDHRLKLELIKMKIRNLTISY